MIFYWIALILLQGLGSLYPVFSLGFQYSKKYLIHSFRDNTRLLTDTGT